MHKMNFYILLLATILIAKACAVDIRKLFYEKDLSEYCKRRVIPSIFLGRHVVEASSFILHFAKLDMPYNCFISVRAESGSNIIMVINLPYDGGLVRSCSENQPPFLVYEMGETFGGYWGPIPEAIMNHKPPGTKFYTLKTTQPTTMSTEPSTEEYIEITTTSPTPSEPTESQEFIEVEVPIVDVSGQLVSGPVRPTKPFDFEDAFDDIYDVTPIPGVKYDTSILPLVQLSVRKHIEDGRRVDGQEQRYDLDVIGEFTPDPRLTLPQLTTRSSNKKRKTNVNRLLSFGKNKSTKSSFYKKLSSTRMTTSKTNRFTKYVFPTTAAPNKYKLDDARDSWEKIDKVMETLKKNKEYEIHDKNFENKSRIMNNISNMKHNLSIYLAPNLAIFDGKNTKASTLTKKRTIAQLLQTLPRTTKDLRKMSTKQTRTTNEPITLSEIKETKPSLSLDKNQTNMITNSTSFSSYTATTGGIKYNSENNVIKKSDIRTSSGTVPPVSLVDHESWENIVQAAPGMAVLLNQTVPYDEGSKVGNLSSLNETRKELFKRKKRAIHSISIENGRPHNITTKATTPTTTRGAFNLADMQEFARLVELQDDDMHGRVALRYLKQYVGPAIYNICGDSQPTSRHVFLFNSSRIVLSLNNFTLKRMSVILTRARTLLSSEMRCPTAQLECQVSGARVCVDSLAACDGVPNCGSYDIYDEDRLLCGAALGLQHNVYLAAFTFLAVLLTAFYAVHYWLKRCVPKVADAFFVYMDGVENILFLDTVMRSPGDYEDGSKLFYHGNLFSGENAEIIKERKKGLCFFWKKCFLCFRNKEAKNEDINEIETLAEGKRKTYSFTQMELSHMSAKPTADTSVQTGDSLQIEVFKEERDHQVEINKENQRFVEDVKEKPKDPTIMIHDSLITLDEPLPEDELSLLKFFRDSRTNSSESVLIKEMRQKSKQDFHAKVGPSGEQEMSSIMYEGIKFKPGPSEVKADTSKSSRSRLSSQTRKRIRFEEAATTIPSEELFDDDDDVDETDTKHYRQVFQLGQTRTLRSQNLGTIKEDDDSGGRHRHFWEGKGKKSHKKSNVLR